MTESEKREVRSVVEEMLRDANVRFELMRPVKDTTANHPDAPVTGKTTETLILVLASGPTDPAEERLAAAVEIGGLPQPHTP